MPLPRVWRWLSAVSLAIPLTAAAQAASPSSQAAQSGLSAADIARLSQDANQRVIVLLRNQHSELSGRFTKAARAAAIGTDQAGIVHELQAVHAPRIQAFHLINAVGATVSQAEVARLRANPVVRAVVTDSIVKAPSVPREAAGTAAAATTAADAPLAAACGTNGKTITEPEALSVTNDYFDDASLPSAQKLATGKGVTVAFIADGLDIHNPDFIRPNGTSVFSDYQDFSGSGANGLTGGGEAFGDAASIAAQGRQTYDVSKYGLPGQSLGTCNIRVLGMAPGASLVGLNVFGSEGGAWNATIVEAVQYAADHGVNILNESFGASLTGDSEDDPIILANDAAIAEGVTVTASTGDSASNGTIGTPATDPNVISVGATTIYRLLEQIGYPGTGRGTGWVNNQLSSLSSAGISSKGDQTVNVVAPGDSGWAICTANLNKYGDCSDFSNRPSPLDFFGGTSESAPLTAGEAALIYQAYRDSHNGADPSPALVKQIIESTATDLHLPGYEQGFGLINALRGVQMALSIADSNGSPRRQGDTLRIATHPNTPASVANVLSVQDLPGTPQTFPIQVTNEGNVPSLTAVSVRTLQYAAPQVTDVTLNASSTQFTDGIGRLSYRVERTFQVSSTTQYLKATVSWDTVRHTPADLVRLSLYEPDGKFVQYSDPQGTGTGYGYVEVHDPQPGTWRAVIWTHKPSIYFGTVHFGVSQERFIPAGTAAPSSLGLAPGYSGTTNVHLSMPAQPGDTTDEIVLTTTGSSGAHTVAIPVILRTLIPTSAGGGSFTGLLLGGNGRDGAPGQLMNYAFKVPAGLRDLDLGIKLNDSNYNLGAVLINPANGVIEAQSTVTGFDKDGNPTGYTNTLQFFRRNPEAGIWKFELVVNQTTSGRQTEEPFVGTITFNGVQVSTTGIPSGATVAAGKPVVATVTVKNTGNETEQFFADPRLAGSTPAIVYENQPTDGDFPPAQGTVNPFLVPTESTEVSAWAETLAPSVPFNLELLQANGTPYATGNGPGFGFNIQSPDILGSRFLDPITGQEGSVATYSAPEVPAGFWLATTALQGPFGHNGAPASQAMVAASVVTQPFDANVNSSSGDLWGTLFGSTAAYTPLTLQPGATGKIQVTFVPKGTPGSTVRGFLYIDTLQAAGGFLTTGNGDELVRIPYSYTIASTK